MINCGFQLLSYSCILLLWDLALPFTHYLISIFMIPIKRRTMHFTYACQKSCQLFMNAICSCVCVSEVCKWWFSTYFYIQKFWALSVLFWGNMKALIVAESFCSIRDSCLKVEEPCGPQTPHMNSMAIKIEAAAATFLTENCSSCSISKPSVIIAKKVRKWSVLVL